MKSTYAIWMRIDCMHEYFRDGKCESFSFIPSADTQRRLANARLRPKVVGNSFLLITESDDANRALVSPAADEPLVFYLELQDPSFLTVTNLDADALRRGRYHLSNLHDNPAGQAPNVELNLSRSIDAFDNAREYLLGELASKGGRVYECIQVGVGQAPDAADSAFWVDKGAFQFASTKDLVPIRPMLSSFQLTSAASRFVIKVHGLNTTSHDYDHLVREEVRSIGSESTAEVQVDLTGLAPGRYRLDINGQVFESYFDDEAVARNAFGVIELHHHLPKTNAYSPVTPTDEIRDVRYVMRFANRRAFWKYVTPLRKVDEILIAGQPGQPSPFTPGSNDPAVAGQKDYFVSNQPLGLSERPDENLFDLVIGSETRPAPKPNPNTPGLLTQTFHAASGTYRDATCTIRLDL